MACSRSTTTFPNYKPHPVAALVPYPDIPVTLDGDGRSYEAIVVDRRQTMAVIVGAEADVSPNPEATSC